MNAARTADDQSRLTFLAVQCAHEWVLQSNETSPTEWTGTLPAADCEWIRTEMGRELSADEGALVLREFRAAYASVMGR